MEARIETESILYRTLWLFGGTFIAAMLVLAAIVWWVSRRGRSVVPA
jgi:preprotein translocase subunit SecG